MIDLLGVYGSCIKVFNLLVLVDWLVECLMPNVQRKVLQLYLGRDQVHQDEKFIQKSGRNWTTMANTFSSATGNVWRVR